MVFYAVTDHMTRLLVLFTCLTLTACNSVFYYPSKDQYFDPRQAGLNCLDVWIENPGEPKLHAWYLPAKNEIATILHLHGNAENISTHLGSVYWLPQKGFSVLTIDYRGYGVSEGAPSLEGVHRDVERSIEYLQNYASKSKLILYGQSLGATMALYFAAQPTLKGAFKVVVAESPFSGYRSVVREKLASLWLTYIFQWPLSFLVSDRFSPLETMDDIAPTPVLLIHGTDDKIISYDNSLQLCQALGQDCKLWTIEGGGHINAMQDTLRRVEFADKLKLFL